MNLFKKLISSVCAFAMLASMAVVVQAADPLDLPANVATENQLQLNVTLADGYDPKSGEGQLIFSVANTQKYFALLTGNGSNVKWRQIVGYQIPIVMPDTVYDVTYYNEMYGPDDSADYENYLTNIKAADFDNTYKVTYGGTFVAPKWDETDKIIGGVYGVLNVQAQSMTTFRSDSEESVDRPLFTVNFKLTEEARKTGTTVDVRNALIQIEGGRGGTVNQKGSVWQLYNEMVVNTCTIPAEPGEGGGEGG